MKRGGFRGMGWQVRENQGRQTWRKSKAFANSGTNRLFHGRKKIILFHAKIEIFENTWQHKLL